MNIAYVSDAVYPYSKGGKEKRLYELSKRLTQLGHEVHIYTMHWWDSEEKTVMQDGVYLHAISKYYPMYRGKVRSVKEGIMFGISCLKLVHIKFDVMDVDHMPFFPVYSTWIVCKLRGKKLYATWHEALTRRDWINYMGFLGNIAYAIEHISIRLPHKISASSKQTIVGLREYHGRFKNVCLVSPGIDVLIIQSVKPLKNKTDILYVGRLVKDKNVDILIKAVSILAKKNKEIKCTIIGSGIEKSSIAELIKELDLINNISMLDSLDNDKDIYAVMKSAQVFCLPSIREGFGMVVLEALTCGTPVVTIDVAANNAAKLISIGINGSLSSLNPSSLASTLSDWIDKPKTKSITKQFSGYDWNNIVKNQETVYLS